MSGWVWLFGTLLTIATYLWLGWRLAIRDLPAAWERARKDWCGEDNVKGSVKLQTVAMVLFWPYVIAGRKLSAAFGAVVEQGDPVTIAANLRSRERHIRDLERELGIGRNA